ncbi:BRCA2 oligonucleotide/oligosaccharide-binding domain-containing protein [Phytophthora infestans]|uniref:BRCA2 oligonucleotide/oligosaccharide-binding domain-containing protein n=1 Tax=Phytophthora infestans TaxID=4787 RepID=A0A8S9UJN4_PHYIN|nr:BRCA2 oligonucleotide/oligosaccharide-binding domain-containing protein [Phytophthora infestans]
MQAGSDADALPWREAFNELLVFEQDFDTAMQILIFQDEKVARLSLEDSQQSRSQRVRSRQEASIRDKTRSPSRKRRRVKRAASQRPEPPPFPLSHTPEDEFALSGTQSDSSSMQLGAGSNTGFVSEVLAPPSSRKDGQKRQLDSGTKMGSAGGRTGPGPDVVGAGRGGEAGTGLVVSLFFTGSGKQVSISKAKLDAYERQMCEDESEVLAPSSSRTDGQVKQLGSGTKMGSAGGRTGPGPDVVGAGRGGEAGTGLVASLFSTGSGKQVSISKAKLDAYERQMCEDESEVLAPSSSRTDGQVKQLGSGTKMGSAGGRTGPGPDVVGAGRGDEAGTGLVASLFFTGSGKQVSISKAKLDAYERQMCDDESEVLAPSSSRTDGQVKQLGSGTKMGSTGGRTGPGPDVVGAGRGNEAGTGLVASLFFTGSGKQVSISKAKLDAYERQMCDDESEVLAPSSSRTDGQVKQLGSGTKMGSAGGRTGPGPDVVGAGRGDEAGTGLVARLFSTGSGKQVSISKAKLDAYERQMCDDESEVLAPSSSRTDGQVKQLGSGTKMGSAGGRTGPGPDVVGAGRGDEAGTGLVASLFFTGSGKQVSISKAKLDAYERQMCDDESEVLAPSSSRTDGQVKQLGSGTKMGSTGGRTGPGPDVVGAGRGDEAGTGLVASLFSTGSGKQVSISKAKLDAYERQMCDDESEVLAPSSARTDGQVKQLGSGTKIGSAGGRTGPGPDVVGAGRGGEAGTGLVASLFSTGSGKQVSISKAKLDAYERQMCDDESEVLAPSSSRTDGQVKQLGSGTKMGSTGGRTGPGPDVVGAGRGDEAGTGLVASLFFTGSGKQVSISKAKLDAYERQMCDDESEVLAPSSSRTDGQVKQLGSGTKMGSAGGRTGPGPDVVGAGRGDEAGTGLVARLFSTGSGKQVSISKAKLDAYERQMCEDESEVLAPSSSRTDGQVKQLGSGTKMGSTGGRTGPGPDVVGAGRGDEAGTGLVASLFFTGSGKQVSISKAKLDAYERQMCEDESEVLAPSSSRTDGQVKQLGSGTKMGSAGGRTGPGPDVAGAGRGDEAGTGLVASLFFTGSGKQVSISKAKLDAYERQMCEDESEVLAPSSSRTDGQVKQLGSGTKMGSAGGRTGPGPDVVGAGRGDEAGTGLVARLFSTGSGKQVSISKAKLDAYERQMCDDESEVLAPSSSRTDGQVKQLGSGTKMGSAGGRTGPGPDVVGAGRGGEAGTGLVASLFSTGSGKQVSISKAKLDAYERQMCDDESEVLAPSSSRTDGQVKQLGSGTKMGSAGGRTGPGPDVVGAGRGDEAGTGLVASLFSTGSGKQVSISKAKLDAYERQMCEDESEVLAPSSSRTDGQVKQLGSGTKMGSAGGRTGPGPDVVGAGRGDEAGTGLVARLFSTGSGKQVSISKAKLDAYERQMCEDESEVLAPSSSRTDGQVKQLGSGTKMGSTGGRTGPGPDVVGAGRGDEAGTGLVARLFSTGSGKQVSISKAKLDAYERQMCDDESEVLAPSSARTDGQVKQLGSGTKIGSAGGRTGPGPDVVGAGRGGEAGTGLVASLFFTGSGKQVSISKAKLDAYERQMCDDGSEGLAPFTIQTNGKLGVVVYDDHNQDACTGLNSRSVTSISCGVDVPIVREVEQSVGNAVNSSITRSSSLTTGPGKVVAISTPHQHADEEKRREKKERSGGSAVHVISEEIVDERVNDPASTSQRPDTTERKVFGELGVSHDRLAHQSVTSNNLAYSNRHRGVSFPSRRLSDSVHPLADNRHHQTQRLDCGDKENVHPENGLIRKTAALEVSKALRPSAISMHLNSGISFNHVALQQKKIRRALKPSIEPRSKMVGKKRFRPPTASKRTSSNNPKNLQDVDYFTASRGKTQRVGDSKAQPFVYVESMKISLKTLIDLHDVGEEDSEPPRLQLLNSITAENAGNVCFGQDGGLILSSDDSYDTSLFVGPRELYRQLRAGNYILEKTGATFVWFLNHYRWIVWKLAAMERSFSRLLLANYLTTDQVLKQMTHRYQRDLNDAQRSIVKKILQRDASPLSCMVLCVAAVLPFSVDSNNAVDQELPACWNMALVLTDGWYSVYAVPDAPLAAILWKLHAKSSLVGTKLAAWNASLQNSTEGIDPLDCAIVRESKWSNPLMATEDLTQWPYLQLRFNSTRRVRLDTRLGVEKLHYVTPVNSRHRKQQPQVSFLLLKSVPLKSLEVGGGMVRSVRVRVTRISPVLHLQSKGWTLGPRILCEEQLPLYFQLRSEYAQAVMRKKHQHEDRDEWSGDDQIDVPLPIPFIKVDVECTHSSSSDRQGIGCGILTIWRPNEDLLSGGLREGLEYYASSLTVNWKLDGGRGQDAFLRLSSTKHSSFEEVREDLAKNDAEITQRRVCVDVQQATTDYRANFEDGTNGRRNERRPTIDVCVCVVLAATRETQEVTSARKTQADISLLDPELKPQESRYVEHVFVTDQSCHLMSIRVSGMEVSTSKKKSNSPLKRSASSSFVFRRGSKNIWKEGAVLCLSGLEVSHYDEQLRVLDCVLVESTQIVSYPSKRSPFWNHFQLLQRERRSSTQLATSFAEELIQLKKYVERDILRMYFVPSQECNEHVEVVEQERLTQDLQAHEQGEDATVADSSNSVYWDARVVKMMPLIGPNRFKFPSGVEAFACVNMGTDDTALRTVYLTREVLLSMQALLQVAGGLDATASDAAEVQTITDMLDKLTNQNVDYLFRFEVRQSTNERLMNSWKPWERLNASYWMAVSVAAIPTVK